MNPNQQQTLKDICAKDGHQSRFRHDCFCEYFSAFEVDGWHSLALRGFLISKPVLVSWFGEENMYLGLDNKWHNKLLFHDGIMPAYQVYATQLITTTDLSIEQILKYFERNKQ